MKKLLGILLLFASAGVLGQSSPFSKPLDTVVVRKHLDTAAVNVVAGSIIASTDSTKARAYINILGVVPISGNITTTTDSTKTRAYVNVLNFPAIQPISGSVNITSGAIADSLHQRIFQYVTVLNPTPTIPDSAHSRSSVLATIVNPTTSVTVSNFPPKVPADSLNQRTSVLATIVNPTTSVSVSNKVPADSLNTRTSTLATIVNPTTSVSVNNKVPADSLNTRSSVLATVVNPTPAIPDSAHARSSVLATIVNPQTSVSVSNLPTTQPVSQVGTFTSQPGLILAQPSGQSLTGTGSIQWTVMGGATYYLTVNNAPAATAAFSGTVVFETSPDNSTWTSVSGNPMIGLPGAGLVPASSTTAAGLWKVTVPATTNYIRARVSVYASGTVWAYLEPTGVPNGIIQVPFTPSVTSGATVSGWIDASGMSNLSIRISGITTTQITTQGTDDPSGTDVQAITMANDAFPNSSQSSTVISSTGTYSIISPAQKWIRFQITTTGTVNTVQGVTANFGQALKISANSSSVSFTGSPQVSLARIGTTDIASSALTSNSTSSAIGISQFQGQSYSVTVTAVSGTNPTLDIVLQESLDGTNWYDAYHWERMTATGFYTTPLLQIRGSQVRYVRTIGGTGSPSFTMSLSRIGTQTEGLFARRFFDRTIVPSTGASASAAFYVEGATTFTCTVVSGAGAASPVVYGVELSEDGTSFWDSGMSLSVAASTTASATVTGITGKFAKIYIKTAQTSATQTYAALRATR